MNKNIREQVSEMLNALQKSKKHLAKKTADLANAIKDSEEFQSEIAQIGTPHYKDDAALTRLTVLERKMQGCSAAITQIESDITDDCGEFSVLIQRAGELAARVLHPLFATRIDTISAVIAPFFHTKDAAHRSAQHTDAARAALSRLQQLNAVGNQGIIRRPDRHLPAVLKVVDDIEAILSESLKKAPDLIQFFRFEPKNHSQDTATGCEESAESINPPVI